MRKKNVKKQKKQRKWKSGLKAGCLALGMATAWGGEARSDVILQVSATPATTLTNAFVYYGNNASTAYLRSLGTLPGGQTTTLVDVIPTNTEPSWWGDPDAYASGASYVIIGMYDEGGSPGVAISFPNDAPITTPKQWAEVFESSWNHGYDYSEAEIIGYLQAADYAELDRFLYNYGDVKRTRNGHPCATEYGNQATLVNFSDPTFGGVVTVTLVPEPAAWVLLVTTAGTLLFWRRDLLCG
jgi:hypothetical protein